MAVNQISKELKQLFDLNSIVKLYLSEYSLMPDSCTVFFDDNHRIHTGCMLGLELYNPYQPLTITGYGGIRINSKALFEVSKEKKSDLGEIIMDGWKVGVRITDGREMFFGVLKSDMESYPTGDHFMQLDDYPDTDDMIALEEDTMDELADRRVVIIGKDDMFLKVAKPLFPTISKTIIKYIVSPSMDDDAKFYCNISLDRTPVRVYKKHICFKIF